jgi:hypothetical protein
MRVLVRSMVLLVVWTSGSLSGGSSGVSSLMPPSSPDATLSLPQCGPEFPRKRGRPRHDDIGDPGMHGTPDQGSPNRRTSLTVGDALDIERMRGGRSERRGRPPGAVNGHHVNGHNPERPRVGRPPLHRARWLDESQVFCAMLQTCCASPANQHLCVMLLCRGLCSA